jgi:hypothetical protein
MADSFTEHTRASAAAQSSKVAEQGRRRYVGSQDPRREFARSRQRAF